MARVFNSKGIVKNATSHEGESDPIITPQEGLLFRNVHPAILEAVIKLVRDAKESNLENPSAESKIIKEQKKRRKFSAAGIRYHEAGIQYDENGNPDFENSAYDPEDEVIQYQDQGDIEDPGSDFEGNSIWDETEDSPPTTNTIFVSPTYVHDTVSTNKAYQVKDCDQCQGVIDSTLEKKEKERYKRLLGITGKCRCNDTGKVCNQCSNNLVIGQVCPSCRVAGTALPGKDTPLGSIETQPLPNVFWDTPNFAYTNEMLTRVAPTSNISSADTAVSDDINRVQSAFGNPLWDDPTYEPNGTEQDETPRKEPIVKEHDSPAGRADPGWKDESSDKPMIETTQTVTRPAREKHNKACICGGTGRIDRVDSNQARALIKNIKTNNANKLVEINSVTNSIERSRQLEELYANIYACPLNRPNNSVEKKIKPPKYKPDDEEYDEDEDGEGDENMDEE